MSRQPNAISIFYTVVMVLLLMLKMVILVTASSSDNSSTRIPFNETILKSFEIFDVENQPSLLEKGRSYICVPLFRVFSVELRYGSLSDDEVVAVSGDHSSLGQWRIAKALPLKPMDIGRTKWYLKVWICAKQRFHYRYLIYAMGAQGERLLRRWEGQQVARMLQTYEIHRSISPDVFGEAYERAVGGGVEIERGWLRNEYVVELKFIWQRHFKIPGAMADAKYRLQLTPLNVLENARVEVSRYAYNRSTFRAQPSTGVRYSAGVIVIFRITQPLGVTNTFRLSIEGIPMKEQTMSVIGESFIFPADLQGSRGILQLPIFAALRQQPVGELTLPYLIIHPYPNVDASNLKVSFHRYWPTNWPTMDVGHRGLGASFYLADTKYVENTIESYRAVIDAKGDMVRVDIQLTRDHVPVAWHAFGFHTAAPGQQVRDRFDLRFVLIRQLKYSELRASRVFVVKRWGIQEIINSNQTHRKLFPTLGEIFEALPKTLGVLIDVKWPQMMAAGLLESTQTQNKNVYVNKLIEVTAKLGCGRPLIFASFDADICTMLRLKQPAFPVLFLTIGASKIWDPYMDLRTQSFLHGVNFAESTEILGTASHMENFVGDEELVNIGLEQQQVVFVWGSDLRDVQVLERFRAMDVSGLIYDQMDKVGPSSWKRAAFFDATQLVEIFGSQCVAIGNSTRPPGIKPPKPTVWPKL